jgi:hypothetical protein
MDLTRASACPAMRGVFAQPGRALDAEPDHEHRATNFRIVRSISPSGSGDRGTRRGPGVSDRALWTNRIIIALLPKWRTGRCQVLTDLASLGSLDSAADDLVSATKANPVLQLRFRASCREVSAGRRRRRVQPAADADAQSMSGHRATISSSRPAARGHPASG